VIVDAFSVNKCSRFNKNRERKMPKSFILKHVFFVSRSSFNTYFSWTKLVNMFYNCMIFSMTCEITVYFKIIHTLPEP